MKITPIHSFDEFQKELFRYKKSYLLLYKSGAEKSDCAYENLKLAAKNTTDNLLIMAADVNEVKDIHIAYDIQTVPALLYFEGGSYKKAIKGCQSTEFYSSLFKNLIYSGGRRNKPGQKLVIVYSTPTCPHCNSLKDYLKRNQISFRDIDVSKDQKMAQELVRKSGQQGVPQTEINGKIVVGFNRPKINELLGINA